MINKSLNQIRNHFDLVNGTKKMSDLADQLLKKYKSGDHQVYLFQGDLDFVTAAQLSKECILAVDTETGGLSPVDHQLHLVQIADLNNNVYIIQKPSDKSHNLRRVLFNSNSIKVCHWMKFDIMFLLKGLRVQPTPSEDYLQDMLAVERSTVGIEKNMDLDKYICTKTLNKLLRPGKWASLKPAVRTFLKTEISKQVEHGSWDRDVLTKEQLSYAATDVLVLLPLVAAQLAEVDSDINLRNRCNYISERVQKTLIDTAVLECHGYTDLLVHSQDERRCKSPLLRRKENQDELDDSRNDGNTGGPKATDSSS